MKMRKITVEGELWRYLIGSEKVTMRGPDGKQRVFKLKEVRADFSDIARGDWDDYTDPEPPDWREEHKGDPTTGAITPRHIRAKILDIQNSERDQVVSR